MADRNVEIGIKTTADTTGVKKMTEAMGVLNASAGTSADKARVFTFASYNLDEALKTGANNVERNSDAVRVGSTNIGKMGMLANQASYQVGDFFTQVEMGTSVTRAFSQQAPQMLGALSSAGVLSGKMALALGGIGAAIPLLAMALPMLTQWFGSIGAAADESTDKTVKLSEKLAELPLKMITDASNEIEAAIENANALRVDLSGMVQAENEYSKAALDNAEKLRTAQENFNVVLGIRVDKYRELREAEKAEKAARDEAQRQQIQGMQDEIAKREKLLQDKEAALERRRALAAQLQAELEVQQRKLETLGINRESLTVASKQSAGSYDKSVGSWAPNSGFDPERADRINTDAKAAQIALEGVGALYESTQQSVDKLAMELKRLTGSSGAAIESEAAKLEGARLQIEKDKEALGMNIDRIVETAKASDTLAKSELAVKVSNQLATDAQGVVDSVTTTNAKVQAQIDTLKAAIPNGIDLTEIQKVSQAMAAIADAIRMGNAETNKQQNEILRELARQREELRLQGITLAGVSQKRGR